MQSSPQAVQAFAPPVAAKASEKASALPLLSLITFSPMGNPLSGLTLQQRKMFFDYLFLSLQSQRREHAEQVALLNRKIVLSDAALGMKRLSNAQSMRRAQLDEAMKISNRNFSALESKDSNSIRKTEEKKAQDEKTAAEAEKSEHWLSYLHMVRRAQIAEAMKNSGAIRKSEEKTGEMVSAPENIQKQGRKIASGIPLAATNGKTEEGKAEWGGGASGEGFAGATGVASWKFSSLFRKRDEDKNEGADKLAGVPHLTALGHKDAHGSLSMSDFSSVYGQKAGAVSGALEQIVPVIDDYARGNAGKEMKVVSNLHESMRASSFQSDDLMASLLLVIEDDAWSSEASGLGSAKPHGGATRLAALVPQKLRSTAQDSAVVRLASVREMLRYYFRKHPEEYHVALASALGITADQEEDSTFMQERLAFMLASIGSFALAQKLLAQIKKKLDTRECLLQLGYRYNVKKKRLILGKRTCGRPAEARGLIGLLLASARKE